MDNQEKENLFKFGKVLTTRLTPEQEVSFRHAARCAGLTLTSAIRNACLLWLRTRQLAEKKELEAIELQESQESQKSQVPDLSNFIQTQGD